MTLHVVSSRRLQIVVLHNDNVYQYHPVPEGQGWKVDTINRQIVVGRGVPRTMIPLDTVRSYTIEEY